MLTLKQIEASLSLSRPIELFLFESGGIQYAYTSGSKQHMHTDGLVYKPLAMSRGKVQRTTDDYKNKLEITLPGDSPVPLLFRSHLPQNHVTLKAFRTQQGAKDQYINIFSGEVTQCSWSNSIATLQCNPVSALLRRQVLRTGYQSQCNHHLYDSRCKLQLQDWQEQTTVTAITNNGYNIEVSAKAHEDSYYSAGILSKDNADFRMITATTGNVFSLISPLDALKVGDNIQIAKGCDRSAAACQSFNNFDNFFGFLAIPTDNPFQVY